MVGSFFSRTGMRTPTGGSGSFDNDDDPAVSSLFREIDMLSSLRPNPSCNVVQYVGAKRNYECVALLYEYMPGGSVKDLLERDGPILPTFGVGKGFGRKVGGGGSGQQCGGGGERRTTASTTASGRGRLESYTRQMLRGVQWLHDSGVCHRDIKCSNLLLSLDSERLKIRLVILAHFVRYYLYF
jgi:serine/threonine protein kinase